MRKKPINKSHSKETIERISETRRKQEAEKKQALIAFQAKSGLSDDESKRLLKVTKRDSYYTDFLELNPSKIKSLISEGQSGQLRTWAEFCDSILRFDSQLGNLVQLRRSWVSGKPLAVQSIVDEPNANECALFVEGQLRKIRNLNSIITHLLFAIFTGTSVVEVVWGYNETTNVYFVADLVPHHLKKFAFDDDLDLCISDMFGDSSLNGRKLKDFPNKFIVHMPKEISAYSNIDGLFRIAAWPSFFKRKAVGYWMSGAERFAFPALVVTVPTQADRSQVENLHSEMQRMTNEGVSVVKEGIRIEALGANANGGEQVWTSVCKYMDAALTKLILGATLNQETYGQGGAARALGEVHERTSQHIVMSDAEKLCRTLERDLAQAILDMNSHLFEAAPESPTLYFDGLAYPVLEDWHVKTGAFRVNELRKSLTYPALAKDLGDKFISPDGIYLNPASPAPGAPTSPEEQPKAPPLAPEASKDS